MGNAQGGPGGPPGGKKDDKKDGEKKKWKSKGGPSRVGRKKTTNNDNKSSHKPTTTVTMPTTTPTTTTNNNNNNKKNNKKSSLKNMLAAQNNSPMHETKTPSHARNKRRSKHKKSSSSKKNRPKYIDAHGREFLVGGVFVVTNHPHHGPSLLIFHNPKINKMTGVARGWESAQGKYEQKHHHILETCRCELFEESAGLIDVTSEHLNKCPYIDLPNSPVPRRNSYKRFYVLRVDHESLLDPQEVFDRNLAILSQLSLERMELDDCYCYLEMNKVAVLPLKNLKESEIGRATPVALKVWDNAPSSSVVHGYQGTMKEPTNCLLWLLKSSLMARGNDSTTGEPTGMTGLELICSVCQECDECNDDKVQSTHADKATTGGGGGGRGESKTVAAVECYNRVSFGKSLRCLGDLNLGSIGVESIHVQDI